MRLVTRGDLDGLTCAVLLQEVEAIESVDLAHPKDVQDGKVELSENDILANLPFDPRAGMWFDHHASEADATAPGSFKGAYALAPSAARVIADHYKAPAFSRFSTLLEATDRLDAAQLMLDDIKHPDGWILVGYTLDPRTGLGAFRDYFQHLMRLARTKPVDEVLADPEVAGRVERVRAEHAAFAKHLAVTSRLDGNVIITDVRGLRDLPSGNRFLIYTLFMRGNVSVRIADGLRGEFVTVQVGHSILNRTCKTHVGDLMARFGGGGHRGAGTCQPKTADADAVITKIIETLKQYG